MDAARAENKEGEKAMTLIISKIIKENIFCDEYKDLKTNNTIDYTDKRIAVLYGPNGTGKTSLAMILSKENDSAYTVEG